MTKKKKILVFRLSAMGDVAMTVPVIKTLVEQNPDTEIIMVSKEFFKAFFENIPSVTFYGVNLDKHKGIGGLYKLFTELKKTQPDIVVDLHDVIRTKILRFFFKLAGYKVYIIDKGRKEKKALIRKKNKVFKSLPTTFERYAKTFEKAGIKMDLSQTQALTKPDLSAQVRLFLENFENKKLIGIAPFAAHTGKQYPLEKIKQIIKELLKRNQDIAIILLGGGAKEKKLLDTLEKIDRNRVVNIAGIFSLEEELQIISRLNKILSMDSGNGHLAAMFGIPVFTIWGATHPYAGFAPFGQLPEQQFIPDLKKFPQLPTSIYGNKTFDNFEQVWETIPSDKIVDKLLENFIRKDN